MNWACLALMDEERLGATLAMLNKTWGEPYEDALCSFRSDYMSTYRFSLRDISGH